MKSDMEVYIGFYLLVVWFFGWSHLLSILIYWQLLRIKYMINYNTQASFRRIDLKVGGFVNRPQCPGLIKMAYTKVKNGMVYMSQLEDP